MPGIIENLDATVIGVPDDDLRALVRGNATRAHELFVATALLPPLQEEAAVAVEFLDAVIPGISDVNHALSVDCHPGREVELPVAGAMDSPLKQELSAAIECLDTVVVIGDEYRAACVDRDSTGDRPADPENELPFAVADAPPGHEELPAAVELLDAMMAGINHIHITRRICRERGRVAQSMVDL